MKEKTMIIGNFIKKSFLLSKKAATETEKITTGNLSLIQCLAIMRVITRTKRLIGGTIIEMSFQVFIKVITKMVRISIGAM
jgi:hypothetical protein